MNRVAVAVVLGLVLSACTARTTSSTTDPPAVPTTTTPAPTTAPIRVLDAPGGIGDRAYPALGNAAYDVIEYDIALHFGAGLESVSGEVRIRALAGDTLGSFSLDFVGYEIDSVEVDGEEAIHERSERDLRLIPVDPIPRDATFEVVVRWSGTPAPVGLRDFVFRTGWQRGDLGSAFLFSEPDGASGLFPSNDHPTDRADVTLSVTVPDGVTVVSAGERSVLTDVDGTLHRFVIPEVAPYLIPLAIGDFEPVESADGVVTWMGNGAPLPRGFDRQAEILAVLEADLGRYPFDTLGAVVVDSDFPAALETQTLPTYTTFSAAWAEPVIAHELAHQWFGNEIALGQWDDIWLNEGLATFMTWRWLEHDFGPGAYRSQVQEAWDRMSAGSFPPPDHPGGTDLFNPTVYDRGGLTIAALRHEVGDEAFFRFLRAYVAEFSDATVTTETFLTFVLVVLGPDAEDLVTRWARDPSLPPVPLG